MMGRTAYYVIGRKEGSAPPLRGEWPAAYMGVVALLTLLYFLFFHPIPTHAAQSSSPVHITADSLTVDQVASTATFSGRVEAIQDEVTLQAEKMVVHYVEGGQENISRIEVMGNVVLSRPGETAKGDEGVYDVRASTISLSGKVVLSKNNNMVQGKKLVYNLKTGHSEITGGVGGVVPGGRVKGVFIPEGDGKR